MSETEGLGVFPLVTLLLQAAGERPFRTPQTLLVIDENVAEVSSGSTETSNETMYTLCAICYITQMARGSSGRIVIEVDPSLKNELYVELARGGLSLKAWFLREAELLVASGKHETQPLHTSAKSGVHHNSRPPRKTK